MDTVWLSYAEMGRAMGITTASAKRLAIRRKWAKRPGNDGLTKVAVPAERLSAAKAAKPVTGDNAGDVPGDDTSDVTGAAASDDTGDDTGNMTEAVTVLSRHVERLEAALDAANTRIGMLERERDAERARAAELHVKVAEL